MMKKRRNSTPRSPSAHVSPATRLYRHALESILGVLTLTDLSRVLAVSREWSAAVRSMRPIQGKIEREHSGGFFEQMRPLPPIASVTLLRHVTAIDIEDAYPSYPWLGNASLAHLAQHAPNLTSIWLALVLMPDEPIIFPAKLLSLKLQLGWKETDAAINGVLTALAAFPSLSHLHLALSAFDNEDAVQLSIFAACPSLGELELGTANHDAPKLATRRWSRLVRLSDICSASPSQGWNLAWSRIFCSSPSLRAGETSNPCRLTPALASCSSRCPHSPCSISATSRVQCALIPADAAVSHIADLERQRFPRRCTAGFAREVHSLS